MTKLHVMFGVYRRCWHKARILLRTIVSFGDFSIELKDFDDSLRVFCVVIFGNSRCSEEFGPFLRQANKVTMNRIEIYVDTMSKIGRIANSTHARATVINGILPVIKFVITLELTIKGLLR